MGSTAWRPQGGAERPAPPQAGSAAPSGRRAAPLAAETTPAGPGARGLEARRRARESRRFYVLTALSTLVPGLGLLRSRPRLARAILAVFALAVAAVVVSILTQGLAGSVIAVGVSRSALLWVIPAIVALAGLWIFGILRTAGDHLPSGSRGLPRVAMLTFAGVAALLVLAPAAQMTRYAVIQRSLIGAVFPSLAPQDATAPGDGADPWAGTDRVNIMLVGSDAGPNREGIRPDSLMVASIDTQTGETVLFGIPRNLQDVPFSESNPLHEQFPDGYSCGDQCLMEMVWSLGEQNAALFPGDPEPGLTVTKDAASQILGLHIDYTTVVDLKGFVELVDAMGGVEVDVKERVCIGCKLNASGVVVGTSGYIEPGRQRLDGYHALWYSRSRAESADGDFSRMRRQRCVVGALVNQVNPVTMLTRYPQLAAVLRDNVSVDIPQEDLDAWAVLVQRIQTTGSIKSLPLTNKNVDVVDPDYDDIHAMVRRAIDPPAPKSTPTEVPSTTSSSSSSSTTEPETESPTPSSSSTTKGDQLSDIRATC